MAVFKGDETPYAQKCKEKASASVAALVTSDAQINKSIEDYIVFSTQLQATVQAISKVVSAYYIEDNCKVRLIEDIIGKGEE